ncbi:hypothetical protein ACFE04_016374 [Oxalis oulophora]
MLGSTNNLSRASPARSSEMLSLPQCLPLEPIKLGNPKYTRSGDLRKVLGVPLGSSTSEDSSFGASHSRATPPVATEDIKHIKESVQDTRKMARDRVQKFSESIVKLDKYSEVLSSKKRQRSDSLSSERSGGASLSKIGNQILRNPHTLITQRLEEKTKGVPLNKRVRSSLPEMRADGRSAASSKLLMATDQEEDLPSAVSEEPAQIEEKIRRLPAGGEGSWDTKKRKRSVGAIGSNRAMAGDREVKRSIMQPKLSADSKKWKSGDPQGFRLKSSSPGVSSMNKLDGAIEPACSDASLILKNELESSSPAERTTTSEHRAKGSNKLNIQDGDLTRNPSTILKAKVSRGPRSNSMTVLDSSSCRAQPLSGSPQAWEQPSTSNKVSLLGTTTNNQKRSTAVGPPLHAMQWVGQRPHKNSRTRRTNLISPVSVHESQTPSPSFGGSDLTVKSSLLVENCTTKMFKREVDNVSSPFSFSESEESGAGDNKIKVGAFVTPIRKNNKISYEIGDGVVRKQERSSLTRPGMMHPVREKLESLPTGKPSGSVRTASDKIKSKSGRPPYKKLKDRKASNRMSLILGGSAEFTGESDDDREELSVAANSARNASNLACSGPFWKKVEPVFSSVSTDDTSYFKKQLSFSEELDESFSQMLSFENNAMKEAAGKSVGLAKMTPLYQRVLSALIEEDDSEEVNHHLSEGKSMTLQYSSDDSHCGSCNLIDVETKDRDKMESEIESESDFRSQNHYFHDRNSCDKSTASIITYKNPSMSSSLLSNEHWSGDEVLSHSSIASEICSDEPREMHGQVFSSSDSHYERMCFDDRLMLELQSIGLFPEALPDLAEEEVINEDVIELTENLYQQVEKKKASLGKIDGAIQEVRHVEKRRIENAAMDELLVMAYRKRMACRGSSSTKSGVRKVSRHVALGFIKRTLARCRKLEVTGSSCFSKASLQDILFSVPQSVDGLGSGTASNTCNEARGSGAVSSTVDNLDRNTSGALQAANSSEQTYPKHGSSMNKLKKREVLIEDVVGSASSRVTSTLDNTVTGARGKREQKTKAKAKPKNNNNQVSTSTTHPTGPARSSSHPTGNTVNRKLSEAEELMDLESLGDIGAFLQFDEEALQALPMDDGLDGLDGYDIPLDDFNLILKG